MLRRQSPWCGAWLRATAQRATELPQGPQTPATSEDHHKGHSGSPGLLNSLFFTSCFLGASLSPSTFYFFLPFFFPLMALVVFYTRRGLPSQRGRSLGRARGRPLWRLWRPLPGPSRLAPVSRAVARCR